LAARLRFYSSQSSMNFHVLLSFLLPCVSAFIPGSMPYSPAIRPPVMAGAQQVQKAPSLTVMHSEKTTEEQGEKDAKVTVAEVKELDVVPGGEFIDTDALLAASTFAIKPDELVKLTKEVLRKGAGVEDPECLAENFEFCAPVVGPLPKDDYISALKNFDLLKAFPDMNNRFYNIHVDPFELNRVWWFTRATATHTGPLLGKPATQKKLELPPQANSFTFNEAGKVTQITVGYVLDRRVGNTGGLGGAFAYFYGPGNALPIPECRPYKKSLQYRFLGLAGKIGKIGKLLPQRRGKQAKLAKLKSVPASA